MAAINRQTIGEIRALFPIFQGRKLIYLDSAATTQKPQSVIDAMSSFYAGEYGTVHRAVYDLAEKATERYNDVRENVRSFINAKKAAEIIFTQGTTASINTVAYSFSKAFLKPGDEVIISELEHHSNIVPWQIACADHGAILRIIPADERGVLDLEAYANLLNEKTKIVSVAHISNAFGTLYPVEKMVAMAHSAGAKILIDGAQAAAHLALDMQQLDVDFYAFSSHKMYGPTGLGILYGKEELLDAMPPYQAGGDMIDTVTFEKTTYNSLPLKFEAGTPMIAEVIGFGAAIDFLRRLTMEAINTWENSLLNYATESLEKVPQLRIIGTAEKKGAIISFTAENIHPLDVGMMLNLRGIAVRTGHHCVQPAMQRFCLPTGTVRLSFGVYNSFDEIDETIAALQDIVKILG
jgi:cysteine desulfurase/selenocysteine lyase